MKSNKAFRNKLITVGVTLGQLREQKGYPTIREFAQEYDLPMIQYWRMEKGKANITLKSLFKVLAIHGLSFHEFFCLVVEEPTV